VCALAAYRAGDWEEVITFTDEAARSLEHPNADYARRGVQSLIQPLRAMTFHRTLTGAEKPEKIDEALRIAVSAISLKRRADGSLVGDSMVGNGGGVNHNAIIGEVLRREAEQLLDAD
jgi:hypothetical protein